MTPAMKLKRLINRPNWNGRTVERTHHPVTIDDVAKCFLIPVAESSSYGKTSGEPVTVKLTNIVDVEGYVIVDCCSALAERFPTFYQHRDTISQEEAHLFRDLLSQLKRFFKPNGVLPLNRGRSVQARMHMQDDAENNGSVAIKHRSSHSFVQICIDLKYY